MHLGSLELKRRLQRRHHLQLPLQHHAVVLRRMQLVLHHQQRTLHVRRRWIESVRTAAAVCERCPSDFGFGRGRFGKSEVLCEELVIGGFGGGWWGRM